MFGVAIGGDWDLNRFGLRNPGDLADGDLDVGDLRAPGGDGPEVVGPVGSDERVPAAAKARVPLILGVGDAIKLLVIDVVGRDLRSQDGLLAVLHDRGGDLLLYDLSGDLVTRAVAYFVGHVLGQCWCADQRQRSSGQTSKGASRRGCHCFYLGEFFCPKFRSVSSRPPGKSDKILAAYVPVASYNTFLFIGMIAGSASVVGGSLGVGASISWVSCELFLRPDGGLLAGKPVPAYNDARASEFVEKSPRETCRIRCRDEMTS